MLEPIFAHRSIRKFQNKPISEEILEQILLAGTRASTTGNMQAYSILVSTDEVKRKELCGLHFNQKMVEQAPVVLTFCADLNRFSKWCEAREAQPGYDNFLWLMNGAIDALLATQNCCLEAEAQGLGICYLGTTLYQADKLISFFNCPELVVPITTVVIGYPDENPPLTDRLPLAAVVHHETYQDYTETAINQLYAEKEALEETKKLIEMNELPNLARIFTDKRYTKKDNVHFSQVLMKVIEQAGFFNHS